MSLSPHKVIVQEDRGRETKAILMPRLYLLVLTSLISLAHIQACEQPAWGQCGGLSWQTCTQCAPGLTCKEWNPYYSQCVPATTTTTSSSSTGSPTIVTSTSVSPTSTSTSTSTLPVYPESSTGLSMYAKRHGKWIGSAYDVQQISDNTYTNIILSNINLITCQNSMKWDATEPSRNNFLTTSAEKIVSIAELNGRRVRGHTLVWHSQLPAWVSSGGWNSTTLTQILVNHITGVVSKFQKRIHTWDVVNEPLNEDGTLRQSVFYKVLGEAYIDLAFNTTRSLDNQPILAINEYNIESAGAKATGMINLVTRLKNRGVPIDQIGVEGHLSLSGVPKDLNTTLTSYTALGVSVAITELDIRIPLPATPEKLAQQASDYVRVVDACLDIPKCIAIAFWTMSDKWSEVPLNWPGTGQATLFDKDLQPKPAYTGVQTLIRTKTRNSTLPL